MKQFVKLMGMLLLLSGLACNLGQEPAELPPPTVIVPTTDPAGTSPTLPPPTLPPDDPNATPTLAVTDDDTTDATPDLNAETPPDTIEALAEWVAQAYTDQADLNELCAALLTAEWQRPDDTCQPADLDGDEIDEWLLTIIAPAEEPPLDLSSPAGEFWIINSSGITYRTKTAQPDSDDFINTALASTLVELIDLTGDDLPEAIITFTNCGVNTCFDNYHIISGHNGTITNAVFIEPIEELDSTEPLVIISLSNVSQASFEPVTDDELTDFVLQGGTFSSVGAGIHRPRTEVWAWDGTAITLAELEYEDTIYRFHWLYDANIAFDAGDYDSARIVYEAIIIDPALEDVEWGGSTADTVRANVQQFAGFRLTLMPLLQGDITEAGRWRNWLQEAHPNAPLTHAAITLMEQWDSNGNNLALACGVVTANITNQDPTGQLTDMGYGNPTLSAEDVCPIE